MSGGDFMNLLGALGGVAVFFICLSSLCKHFLIPTFCGSNDDSSTENMIEEKQKNKSNTFSNGYKNSETEIDQVQENLLINQSAERNYSETNPPLLLPYDITDKPETEIHEFQKMSAPTNLPILLPNNPKIEISKFPTNPDLHQEGERSSPLPIPYPLGIKSITNSDLYQGRTLSPTYSCYSTTPEDIPSPPYPTVV